MTTLCTASLQLHPLHGLHKELAMHSAPAGKAPHGELQLHLKRHTGRVKVQADLYVLLEHHGLETWAPAAEAGTLQLLAAKAVQSGNVLLCS